MPATSQRQSNLFNLVQAQKEGKLKADSLAPGLQKKVTRMAGELSLDQIKDYTRPRATPPPPPPGRTSQARHARSF